MSKLQDRCHFAERQAKEWRRTASILETQLAQAKAENAELNRDKERLRSDISGGLEAWQEGYIYELESCDRWIKWCEKRKDSHGVNFHQGLRGGLVHCDIILTKLKDATKTAIAGRKA